MSPLVKIHRWPSSLVKHAPYVKRLDRQEAEDLAASEESCDTSYPPMTLSSYADLVEGRAVPIGGDGHRSRRGGQQ